LKVSGVREEEPSRISEETGANNGDPADWTICVEGGTQATLSVDVVPGTVLAGRYQIEAALGRGGSGTVYRAWDRVLGEPIAVKILHAERGREKSWIRRLAREVKVARAIRHPNVCRVFELVHADGHWFVTMELGAGGTLRDLLVGAGAPGEPLRPLAVRLDDVRAVCAGLAAIHAVGIIHRDVTPQNVLRMADRRLVLSDFGLAIEMTANTTAHGGTPNYMPPETLLGARGDQRADVWQLGVIMHETLFGVRPVFDRDGERTKLRPPPVAQGSAVEAALARLCAECLAGDPAQRPATAMVVVGRLAAAEVARPVSVFERAWSRASRAARHGPLPIAVAFAVLLVLGSVRVLRPADSPVPACRTASDRLDGVWDVSGKSLAKRAFETTGRPYAADTFATVDRMLDDYLTRWTRIYSDACQAMNARTDASDEAMDARIGCLRDRLAGVRSLAAIYRQADPAVVASAVAAAGALAPLDACADARTLRDVAPPPDRPAREAVEQIRTRLASAKALRDSGNAARAAAQIDGLLAAARATRYGPLLAEALILRGEIAFATGDPAAAEPAIKQAIWQAEASRDDDAKALAAVDLVAVETRLARLDQAGDWGEGATAMLDRLGGHDRLRAKLESNLAALDRARGANRDALAHVERAIDLAQQSGASWDEIAQGDADLALTLAALGRFEEAAAYDERAIRELSAALGRDHPRVAATKFALARALWDGARDRGRARQLAVEARDAYARDPARRAEVAAVDRWLTDRVAG
jgi:eukaryotic-like serine/threonine-protein kinase